MQSCLEIFERSRALAFIKLSEDAAIFAPNSCFVSVVFNKGFRDALKLHLTPEKCLNWNFLLSSTLSALSDCLSFVPWFLATQTSQNKLRTGRHRAEPNWLSDQDPTACWVDGKNNRSPSLEAPWTVKVNISFKFWHQVDSEKYMDLFWCRCHAHMKWINITSEDFLENLWFVSLGRCLSQTMYLESLILSD